MFRCFPSPCLFLYLVSEISGIGSCNCKAQSVLHPINAQALSEYLDPKWVLYNRPGRGRKGTFTPEQIEQIRAWTQQYPRQLKQVVQKVQQDWGISISTKTIKRVLKAVRMSWHRFRRVVSGQPNVQEYLQNKPNSKP